MRRVREKLGKFKKNHLFLAFIERRVLYCKKISSILVRTLFYSHDFYETLLFFICLGFIKFPGFC
jgi:hypothetical protein